MSSNNIPILSNITRNTLPSMLPEQLTIDLKFNNISFVRGSFSGSFDVLTNQEEVCCAIGWNNCPNSTINVTTCSLITKDSLPVIITSFTLGFGAIAVNLAPLSHRNIKSKSVPDISVPGLELAGGCIGVSLVLAGFKDILFDIEYTSQQFGGEHLWYNAVDTMHSVSTSFYLPCCVAHVYIMYLSLKQLIPVRSKVTRKSVYFMFSVALIQVPLVLIREKYCSHNWRNDICIIMVMTIAIYKCAVTFLSAFAVIFFLIRIYRIITGSGKALASFVRKIAFRFMICPFVLTVPQLILLLIISFDYQTYKAFIGILTCCFAILTHCGMILIVINVLLL